MNKKGQAAMEFLMTYGWAILVVLLAIGALAYFGLLNPTVPDKTTFGVPFISLDSGLYTADNTSSTIQIALKNGAGNSVTLP
ncbi:hypothetical protein K9L67_02665 [Candidatus Woesearchaeota archaeon]|nr:hypothetical protein [Candidatus Woesearchaeota archaeon]MCF7901106.1 hypothetical protein [Candidatus Woesearchaeota archaeon]MCF8013439.1 hypothetical protein [Candidatus Woesearchaeota archaeon]